MFVSHFHLRRFGVYDIPFFQIQYLLVGFSFIFILLSPILVLIVFLTIAKRQISMVSKILELAIVSILVTFVLLYMILFFFYGDFEWRWIFTKSGQIIAIGNLYWLLYVWLLYATGKSLIDDLKKIKRGEILPTKELWVPAVFLLTLFILYSTFYANIVHINIHSSLGGGKPIPAEIIISEQGKETVESLGLTLDSTRNLREIAIIHQTSSTLYIIPSTEDSIKIKSLAISSSLIQSIQYLSDGNQR